MNPDISSRSSAGFDRVRFIMVQPSHPGNVGAAARAIKTMGFHELCLVAPRQPGMTGHEQAVAMASGAQDVLEASCEYPSLEEALAPVSLALALTARPRVQGPPALDIRQASQWACAHLADHARHRLAIVLGPEQAGLSNAHLALCQRVCHIPANPHYSSLNLAQAAQLVAWELRYALATHSALPLLPDTGGAIEAGTQAATQENLQALLVHLQQALTAIGFLDPSKPKKLMWHMQHILVRSLLSHDEVNMLRGMCSAMLDTARKNTDQG